MAIYSIGLSFFGPNKYEKTERGGYDYADFTKRLMVHKGDYDSPVYLKWRTASGSDVNKSFDIALNYRVVPKVTTEGGAISGWATDWSTWAEKVPASSCNARPTDGEGGYQWSLDFAWLLNECGIRDFLILNGSFAFDNRYYDRIEFGIRIKSHYDMGGSDEGGEDEILGLDAVSTSPRTDDTFILDYVPRYAVTRVYCDSIDFVKVEYECNGWMRSDDRFCIEAFSINGEPALASKPWGTITRTYDASTGTTIGTAAFPVSALTDHPIGGTVDLEIRFNPSYGATGEEFARATLYAPVTCQGGGEANSPLFFTSPNINGLLEIKPQDSNENIKPITHCFVKMRGSGKSFDQMIVPIDKWAALPYVPRGVSLSFAAVGVAYDEGGDPLLSHVHRFEATAAPSAPVEVVSLRDPSARAMARYDLNISDDFMPAMETFKLSGRERETVCYGEGGSSAWSLSANLVKGVADAYDTEEAWRKVAASGDCVLLLSDGTRRVVSIGDLRFNRSHPSFTGISATLREVDA